MFKKIIPKRFWNKLGLRDWVYYEDFFGSGEERVVMHIRICQVTDIVELYNFDIKKFELWES